MRKKGPASVRQWGGVVGPVRGWGERRHRLARNSSLPLMQVKSQEGGEAGRLPQRQRSCHPTPPPATVPGRKGRGGSGKDGGWGI